MFAPTSTHSLVTSMRLLLRQLTILLCTVFLAAAITAQTREPQTADEYDRAGFVAQQARKFEEALQSYALGVKLNSKDWFALANSGICYMALEKFESAITSFKAAAILMPTEARLQFY